MMEKDKRQQRHSAEDATFNKMLVWLAAAVLAELLVLLVKRLYVDFTVSDMNLSIAMGLLAFFRVYRFVGLALTAAGAAWVALTLKSKRKACLPLVCTGVVLVLWIVTMFSYYLYADGVRILMALPVVWAVLVLIYFLYQRTFFVNAVLTGGGMAALWLYRQYYQGHPTVVTACFVCGWIVLALMVLLGVRLGRKDTKPWPVQQLLKEASYGMIYLTCAVTAVSMLLGLLLGATAAFYLIFVLVGWLFCQAVYYTVKLM